MKFYVFLCLILPLLAVSINGEELEEFPLDFDEDGQQSTETQPGSEINKISGSSSSLQTLEQQRNDVMKRVVANAMNKPGAKIKLAQVMPILRTMSGPQRLALAALVSAQVMASPREPLPPPHDPAHNVTSQLMLPISQDIATMFRGLGREEGVGRRGDQQVQQRSRQSYNTFNNNVVPNRREGHVPNEILSPPPPPRHPPSRSQGHQRQGQGHDQGQGQTAPFNGGEPTSDDCEFFTSSLCLEDTNYPKSDILKSLRNSQNKEAFSSLLQDAKYEIKDLDSSVNDHIERRQGDTSMIDNSKMCASRVEMAKPKRARTTMGNWKYIVNTGDYSQSLRLEMCLRPQASCSYIAPGVRSECMQVYNYHRLLTWDQSTGLAMDMFKVPTCCSCHIQNGFMGGQSPRPPMPSGLPTMFPESGPESNFITSELMSQAMQRLPPGMLQGMRMRGDMLGHHNIPKRESNSGGAGTPRRPPQGTVIHRGPPLPLQDEAPPEAPPRYPPYHNNVRRTSLRNHSSEQIRSDEGRQKIRGSIPLTPNQRHPDLPADNMIPSVTSQQHPSQMTSHLSSVTSQQHSSQMKSHLSSVTSQQHPSQMTSHLSSVTSQQHPSQMTSHLSSVTSQQHPSQMTSRLPVTSPRSPVTSLTPVTSPVTTLVTVAPSRRINYSYHPIIDFFKTATSAVSNEEERSMDRADWRPVTEALLLHSKKPKQKE